MAAKTTAFDTALLQLLFNGTSITSLAQNIAASPATVLYISLHTASPGIGGTQSTSEAAYTSYARQSVARTSGGFNVAAGVANLVNNLSFPTATGGTETETYWGIGLSASGAGTLLYFGPISPTIAVSNGVTPQLTSASTVTET
jgi:hypothetical protein